MSFYDDYSNTPDKSYTTGYNNLLDAGTNQHAESLPTSSDNLAVPTIGLLTGTKVRVIEDPGDLTKGQWLATASFYDDRTRVVQTQSDNYKGGQDTMTTRYNFAGKVITSYLAHTNPAATTVNNTRIKTNMDYDHTNRLLQVYKTINDADSTKRLIAQYTYDQLGQTAKKQLGQLPAGGSFLETQDYSYNIRGWLKGINKDYANNDNSHGGNSRWFGMELSYDWGFDHNDLNGNIGGMKWRSKGDGQQRSYGFGYDDLNRLLCSDFNQYSGSSWDKSAGMDFSTLMGNGTDPNTAYDENGNIKAMLQVGWKLGGSNPIDSLNYTYFTSSNKLQNVIDGRNDPTTTLGDFRTSSLSPYNTGKTNTAQDYYFDPKGNMTRDLNIDIGSQSTDGIVYNHLNLPWQITVRSATGTKGTITFVYDASGNKLKKTTIDIAGGIQTVTTYIGGFQYQGRQSLGTSIPADTLQFFGHEEGRVRVIQDTAGGQNNSSYKYDYFLKDHLDNTRMVLTDEQETDMYPAATMEVADSSLENLYYSKLDSSRSTLPPGYPTDTTTNPNVYVTKLQATGGTPKIGPGITLKVMAGDQFSIRVSSWYKLNGALPSAPANPLPDVLSALISGVGNLPSTGHPTPSQLTSNSSILSSNITNFLSDTGSTIVETRPHAFVTWVLFDNQFNYVASSSGFDQVGTDQEFHHHTLTNLPIDKSGYLYIYLSNETPNIAVFFDNLQVTHVRGPMLEEDHYYPFGLYMAGISDKSLKTSYAENKYLYNDKELQDQEFTDGAGLEAFDYGARFYAEQIGRWFGIDPKSDQIYGQSPYGFSLNNPVRFADPDGMKPADIVYFDRTGKEISRIQSTTVFRTYVETGKGVAGWGNLVTTFTEAPMPNIIQQRAGENTTTSQFQKNDYQIAASTFLFNQEKNNGTLQLYSDGNAPIPQSANSQIPNLDPTLVKAIATQETDAGNNSSMNGNQDIMQSNNKGDWGSGYKENYGLSNAEVPTVQESVNAGIDILATKGFKGGITYDPKTGQQTFTFQGWNSAVEKYNGGGVGGYANSVSSMTSTAQLPKPDNYVAPGTPPHPFVLLHFW